MPLRSRADSRARRCLSSSSAIAVMKTVWIAQVFRQAPHTINSAKIPANAWLHWQGCLLFLRSLRLFAAKSLDQFHHPPLPCLYPDRIWVICSSLPILGARSITPSGHDLRSHHLRAIALRVVKKTNQSILPHSPYLARSIPVIRG